jgi:hypothetical protein
MNTLNKTNNLEYYINLFDKVLEEFVSIDVNFERSSTVAKKLSDSITCHREISHKRKSQWIFIMKFLKEVPTVTSAFNTTTLISE